jgi:hypothetical protein
MPKRSMWDLLNPRLPRSRFTSLYLGIRTQVNRKRQQRVGPYQAAILREEGLARHRRVSKMQGFARQDRGGGFATRPHSFLIPLSAESTTRAEHRRQFRYTAFGRRVYGESPYPFKYPHRGTRTHWR